MNEVVARFQDLPPYTEIALANNLLGNLSKIDQEHEPVLLYNNDEATLVESDSYPMSSEQVLQLRGVLQGEGKKLVGRVLALQSLVHELNHPQTQEDEELEAEHELTSMELWFDRLIADGIEAGASDVHITVTPRQSKVEFRVHGDLRLYDAFPRARLESLCRTVYNAMAQADTKETSFDEKTMQAGQIVRMIGNIEVMVRYQSMTNYPSEFDITLRLLPISQDAGYLELEELGFSGEQIEGLELALAAK